MNYVFINNRLTPEGEARIPVDDPGFLRGDAVFTSFRCYAGAPFRLELHLERLNASLASPLIDIPYKADAFQVREQIAQLLDKNEISDARMRLTVSRGKSGAGGDALTLLTAAPYAGVIGKPLRLGIPSLRREGSAGISQHKTANFAFNFSARRLAVVAGFDDAVIVDCDNNILEAATSNFFCVKDGVLHTPPLGMNLLPGISRFTVIECAGKLGIPVVEENVTADFAGKSEEVFISNSIAEIIPVRELDGAAFDPAPGEITAKLQQAYRALVVRETGKGQL